MLWLTIIVFIGLLLILVLAHEWGHFIAAKKAGCKVEEFGFGFPPRLASFHWHGTLYSLNALPLGGFVRIEGEDMEEDAPGADSFASQPTWSKVIILTAGVVMNVVVAVIFLSIQGVVGSPTLITSENAANLTNPLTYVVEVTANSPAETAQLKALDRIVSIDGQANPTIEDIQAITSQQAGQIVMLEIERQGQHETISLIPRTDPPPNEGAIGIQLASTGLIRVPWWQAPWYGLQRTGQMLLTITSEFAGIITRLFHGVGVGDNLTGPVGIAVYANEVTQLGFSYILEFGALISLNLALINILPIPALDGGRVMFVLAQKVLGRRFPWKIEQFSHTVGFVLLIALMLFITLRDIHRFL